MPEYYSFYQKQTDIIIKALQFTSQKINEYHKGVLGTIGKTHQKAILEKNERLQGQINRAMTLIKEHPNANRFRIDETSLKEITDTIRSSLEIYEEEITRIANKYDIAEYKKEKNKIKEIIKTEILRDAQIKLFEKYYEHPRKQGSRIEFFISYSSKDKKVAGRIRDLIKDHNIEVFLAHRDIPLSKEWRDEIRSKLESCSHLIAVCTENYQCSAWGNQEVGIALEKGKNIIPIFAEGTFKARFGFLETKQGYPKDFTEKNIEGIVEKILTSSTISLKEIPTEALTKSRPADIIAQDLSYLRNLISSDLDTQQYQNREYPTDVFSNFEKELMRELSVETFRKIQNTYNAIKRLFHPTITNREKNKQNYEKTIQLIDETIALLS